MGIMSDFLWNLDLTLFKFINQTLSFGWLDQITPVLTDIHHHFAIIKFGLPLLILTFFLKKYKRTGLTYFLFFILAASTSDFVGGKVKKIFLRPRPFQIAETQAIQKAPAGTNNSFYSNHASNNFAAATYLAAFFPGGQIYFLSIAGFIALTRVHTGVHYPSDIFVGALMGILWGFFFSRLIKLIIAKQKEKLP
jgi:undecaprenyl-diphosphatase